MSGKIATGILGLAFLFELGFMGLVVLEYRSVEKTLPSDAISFEERVHSSERAVPEEYPPLERPLIVETPPPSVSSGDSLRPLVVTSGPLESSVSNEEKPPGTLTISGVIQETNRARFSHGGLVPLQENTTLNETARLKLDDMFQNQYFEHVSSSGLGPSFFAEKAGYQYVALGENLARGIFAHDGALVDAWMESPGHRANILNNQYREIGVAARKGFYEGKETWIIVQMFGSPISACPVIDLNLKALIETANEELFVLRDEIDALLAAMEQTPQGTPEYSALVDAYNARIVPYNTLVAINKERVDTYNLQVKNFNECANGNGS